MSAAGSILTNTGALEALYSISNSTGATNMLENELSSGLAINSPADNPAGYITAQGFTSQISGTMQAVSNANEGVSLLQTAQGAITQQISVLQQLNSIAVQAANGTQTPGEAQSLQSVVEQLTSQVSTIAGQTQFNKINLLDGSFQGKQFQFGANEGQTMSLSINSTEASQIGMWTSSGSVYGARTSFSSSFGSFGTGYGSGNGWGSGNIVVSGPLGGSHSFAVKAVEAAGTLATQVSAVSGTTGVQAVASNTFNYKLSNFTSGSGFAFEIGTSSGSFFNNQMQINAASANQVVQQINGMTSKTGLSAALNDDGSLQITQAQGMNVAITNVAHGVFKSSGGQTRGAGGTNLAWVQQGMVKFMSSGAFSIGGGKLVGVSSNTKLDALSNIDVSTVSGANDAINVVQYALAALGGEAGQLGAVQQSLQANINNLNTTGQNLTTALGVVQDANIPAVSNNLTESEIQAQSGVAALKSSSELQQSFLSLLP